ncbi:MAG: ABC transporter permease [Spirochaetota bacterium]
MLQFIAKRVLIMIPTLLLVSIISFWIIQLPPGDYVTTYAASLREMGEEVDAARMEAMRESLGIDQPFHQQYLRWISGILFRGDWGFSFEWRVRVGYLIQSRIGTTLILSLSTLVFTYLVAIPIGVFSATHQYSVGDYVATFFGFLGVATPNFLFALVLLYLAFEWFGVNLSGLFSLEYLDAPWSWARVWDLIKHLPIPIIVIGTAGTAGLIRVMRSQLLDEIRKQYVITARSKGVEERRLLFKYPVRAALNPIVSTIGWSLTGIFSGATITAIVLNLQTQGPLLYRALRSQDMYLAGGFLMILATLTVIGTLLSDILLAWLDPRIRYGRKS